VEMPSLRERRLISRDTIEAPDRSGASNKELGGGDTEIELMPRGIVGFVMKGLAEPRRPPFEGGGHHSAVSTSMNPWPREGLGRRGEEMIFAGRVERTWREFGAGR